MTCYLVQPRDQIFVKGYGFFFLEFCLLLKMWVRILVKI